MNIDPTLVARIALRFDALLRDAIAADDYAEVCCRNAAEADANVCHSHDFCDANMTMCEALIDLGITPDIDDDRCAALWTAAWNLWKALPKTIECQHDNATYLLRAEWHDPRCEIELYAPDGFDVVPTGLFVSDIPRGDEPLAARAIRLVAAFLTLADYSDE